MLEFEVGGGVIVLIWMWKPVRCNSGWRERSIYARTERTLYYPLYSHKHTPNLDTQERDTRFAKTMLGTLEHMAPELLEARASKSTYGKSIEFW